MLAKIALELHTTKNNNSHPLVCRLSRCCTVVELLFVTHMLPQAIPTGCQMFAAFVEFRLFDSIKGLHLFSDVAIYTVC